MKKQLGLDSVSLDKIFAQIKSTNDSRIGNQIYTAYVPYVAVYAKQFKLKPEAVQDIFTEVFSYLYDEALQGIINGAEFNKYFATLMAKRCEKRNEETSSYHGRIIESLCAKSLECEDEQDFEREESRKFATQSLLFTVSFLNELKNNPELAEQYGLNATKIDMIKDFYGLNKDRIQCDIKTLAIKYNLTQQRVQAMLVSALKCMRNIDAFQPIKDQLK